MPFEPESKLAWTKKEYTKATKAPVIANFDTLKYMV